MHSASIYMAEGLHCFSLIESAEWVCKVLKQSQTHETRENLKVASNWTSMVSGLVCVEHYQTGWVRLNLAESGWARLSLAGVG